NHFRSSTICQASESTNGKKKTDPVSFYLSGKWLNTPFRCTHLGRGENGELLYGEDLVLGIVANEKLKSAILEVKVEARWPDGQYEKELIFPDIFTGNVCKEYSKEFLIYRRKFYVAQTSQPNESDKGRSHFSKRFDIETVFIDGFGNETPVTSGLHSIKLTIFHEKGPTKAFLSLDTDTVEAPHSRAVIAGGAICDVTANNFFRVELPTLRIF
ncbi:MAG TPA: hypothetical protein VKA94_15125, partial [Hyphomicrobiales bacterium]|nr:hypothetical protein [Hyphomicrobiales bacterium]